MPLGLFLFTMFKEARGDRGGGGKQQISELQ